MEAKLKEYRALRKRKETLECTEEKIEKPKEKLANFLIPKIFRKMNKIKQEEEVLLVSFDELTINI